VTAVAKGLAAGLMSLAVWAGAAPGALCQDLKVVGLDGVEKTLSASAIKALPRARAEVRWGEQASVYEGAKLAAVLRAAGVPVGARLHGDPLMAYVVAEGADGFKAVYSLAEVDDAFHAGATVLADTVDGRPLPDKQAPFRVVAAPDSKPWRSVHSVAKLTVKSAK